MATIMSVNALQSAVVRAERQVQQGQSRVSQDASRLDQSESQLSKDRETLARSQRESAAAAQQPTQQAPQINLSRVIELSSRSGLTLPAELSPSRPQINTLGQTIGKFVNVAA